MVRAELIDRDAGCECFSQVPPVLSVPVSFQNSSTQGTRSWTQPFGQRSRHPHPARAEVFHGNVNDPDQLRTAMEAVDGIIHAAFSHDFSNLKQHSEDDRKVIKALGEGLR
jgi:hypothetical protein